MNPLYKMINYDNYFFEFFLIPQIKGDIKQRQERVDELEKCHFAYQVIIIFRLFSIIFCGGGEENKRHLMKYDTYKWQTFVVEPHRQFIVKLIHQGYGTCQQNFRYHTQPTNYTTLR